MSETELFIETRGKRTAFAPGETLEVSALWSLSKPPLSLEARLFWFTRGQGTEDVGIVSSQLVDAPAAAGKHVFTFVLPDWPYSFSGKLISVLWSVELVAEPDSKHVRCEFVVAPNRTEILLTPIATHASTR